MRKLYLLVVLLSMTAFAQDYQKQWEKVIDLENQGKIKSANSVVEKIYKKAKSRKNEPQIVKTFFFRSKFMFTLEEDAQVKILENLNTEIIAATPATKGLLRVIYARCLNDYLSRNQWKLAQRSAVDSIPTADFRTWTREEFNSEISKAYDQSLENPELLAREKLKKYDQVFDYLDESEFEGQSMLDYLLVENINHRVSKLQPYYAYMAKLRPFETVLSADSETFRNAKFVDIPEEVNRVLTLFQQLETHFPSPGNRFLRLKIVHDYFLASDLEYVKLLDRLQKKTADTLMSANIRLEKANVYSHLGESQKNSEFKIKAVNILDSIIGKAGRANAEVLAQSLKNRITQRSLSMKMDVELYPFENARARVDFKDVDSLRVSYYKIPASEMNFFRRNHNLIDSLISLVKRGKPMYSAVHILPNKRDYTEHSTEILLPKIDAGMYLACFETDGFERDKSSSAYEIVTSSNITLLSTDRENKRLLTVLNRKTGKPMEGVRIKNDAFDLTTDKDGNATYLPLTSDYINESTIVSTATDTLIAEYHSYGYYRDYKDDSATGTAELYLDRAIYRPGQTVFFKGILLTKKENKTAVVGRTSITVVVSDPEYKDVFTQTILTNEFGSFSGEFKVPTSGITGKYLITTEEPEDYENDPTYDKEEDEHPFWDNVDFNDRETEFQVEEYKRPKFQVTFEPVIENYTIGQKITVRGNAKSFAGSALSGADAKYSVTRRTKKLRKKGENRFNFGDYYDPYEYANASVTIVQDTAKIDASGNFEVVFPSDALENDNRDEKPIYTYTISVDVTDVNQETRSAQTNVNVGYHSLQLGVNVLDAAKKKGSRFSLSSTNLNNQFTAVKGKLEFYYVSPLSSKFKPRKFKQPDIESIDAGEFARLFPNEERNENANTDGKLVKTIHVDTANKKDLSIDLSDLQVGNYRLVFSAVDASGKIETTTTLELNDPNLNIDPKLLFKISQLNSDSRKDGFAKIRISSPIADLTVRLNAVYEQETYFEKSITLVNNEAIVRIPVRAEFRNSILISADGFFDNYFHSTQFTSLIKIDEPLLELETSTFRNRIEPGTAETWSFKLSAKNTSLQSEVLASMYDASLDQFAKQDWQMPYFARKSNQGNPRNVVERYANGLWFSHLDENVPMRSLRLEETQLIWFGFNFSGDRLGYNNKQYRDQVTKKLAKPANDVVIAGVVSDYAGVLPGASVMVKGTKRGVQTDIDGYYSIAAAAGETLVFSFVGMSDREVKVVDRRNIDVMLESGDLLGEVVVTTAVGIRKNQNEVTASSVAVVGYGTQNSNSAVQDLVGRISGLQISTDRSSGNPDTRIVLRGNRSTSSNGGALIVVDGKIVTVGEFQKLNPADILDVSVIKGLQGAALYGIDGKNGVIIIVTKKSTEVLTQVKTRTNFNETAFFFPHLRTDESGNIKLSFTSPESLTQWKLRLLAHNKSGVSTQIQKYVTTQKSLMVMPNFPRFLRERDTIVVSAKISNMTSQPMSGTAMLQLFDATTMQAVDVKALNTKNVKSFVVNASGNEAISWKIFVPEGLQGVQYRIVAKAGEFSDGEENILPVLTNNMLVTETQALWVREKSRKEYVFENLKNNTSTTMKPHLLTLEYTSNPAWLALQSLPYLMEYEHECAEQTFSRFYANALATQIIGSNPKIAEIFETWRKNPQSKFDLNEELKSILIAETPWLNDAKSDSEQKQKLAVLFDLEKMKASQQATFKKLQLKQQGSGGFAWFDGGRESDYITRHIVAGLGHLKKFGTLADDAEVDAMAKKAIAFSDAEFTKWISTDESKKRYFRPYSDLHYLYARSFFLADYPLPENIRTFTKLGLEQLKSNWLDLGLYEKGMAALVLHRFGEKEPAGKIVESLRETASYNEDWGMYWIANNSGWYWYQAPIETQALLIEAFDEVANDRKSIDAMKVWLLKNKQQKNWPTTKSTTEAVYALLMRGSDWLDVKDNTVFKIGNEKIATKKMDETEKEAATGYVKINWKASEIKKEMATLSVENKSSVPGFGGFYFQYFEDLDKIKSHSGAMKIEKQLYHKVLGDSKLQGITTENSLKAGDLVTVRIIVTVTEDMEYAHLKDMRASCFEPVDVLSGYHWDANASYYKSTRDAATHFFFDSLPKGVYVFEYDLRVNNTGDFSNGITTIQSMYAPEFSGHSKGIRVKVR
ncbi:MAG: hypothetical protein EOO50_12930 [Flavobacterium sp.]|uniref:alpha-2-macroglobulin family protein n=1 Tax=Flavobacterium sp. TaxID=239 RepID=UPI0011F4E6BE|nr:MG2 domain-containing protein [Flavobacterium sp.]RZJ65648.1 MAG: hypothetical protein EOO50_12930 [Flavobacterium sp.]